MGRRIWFGVTVIVAAACIGLGFWQLGRRAERRAANSVALTGRSLGPLDVNRDPTALPAQRRVVVRGRFDHGQQVILRGHLWRGAPGVHVVTPLRITGQEVAIMVNRGFVPAGDAATPDAPVPDEPGEVSLEGIVVPIPVTTDSGAPVVRAGQTTWRRLDLPTLQGRLPYPIVDLYLLPATPNAANPWPRRVDWPGLDEGPHLSYAIQWFGIAAAVLAFGVVFVLGAGRGSGGVLVPAPPPPPR